MHRRRSQSGFTLLELILVMLIACTAIALAAPALSGWRRGATLRNAAEEFIRMTRMARAKSVANATVCRIQIDTSKLDFFLTIQQGTEVVKVNDSMARSAVVIEGGRITISKIATGTNIATNAEMIEFYPTGRVEPARITLTDDSGKTLEIECVSPAEGFRLVTGGQS
jgi:type II secretion system protein H